MTTVAHRHFIGRKTKLEIAASLGISRFKVARLIDAAVESGAVRFVIADQEEYDTGLAEALEPSNTDCGMLSWCAPTNCLPLK